MALKGIEGNKKVPVIVGGTNYYIETLLYNLKSLAETKESSEEDDLEDKEEAPALAIDHKPSQ